jgi:hypothetical protein
VTLVNDYASTLSLKSNALPMLAEVLRIWWRANFRQLPPIPRLVYLERDLDESKWIALWEKQNGIRFGAGSHLNRENNAGGEVIAPFFFKKAV